MRKVVRRMAKKQEKCRKERLMEDVFIRLSDICNAILDFVSSGEYKDVIQDEDMNGFIGGLGIAGTVIYARCRRYVGKIEEVERKDE